MKQKVIRTFLFLALLSLLQPVAVSASEIAQLTQGNQKESASIEDSPVEKTEGSSALSVTEEKSVSDVVEIPAETSNEEQQFEDTESAPDETETSTTESTESSSSQTEDTKPSETRPSETTSSESKPSETKPSKTRPSESKPQPRPKPVEPSISNSAQPVHSVGPIYEEEPQVEAESTVSIGGEVSFTFNNTTEEFIKKIGPLAAQIGNKQDLYASVMIAQAILESASGNSTLAGMPNYNLFGIKGNYKGKSVAMPTQEDTGSGALYTINANFRRYPSYKESLEDYAKLLKEGISGNSGFYQGTWKSKTRSYEEATAFLTGKYATDTQYAAKLNGLINTYNLTRYDKFDTEMETLLASITMGPKEEKLVAEATQFLGLPYVWGGTTPKGFDCSGLIQYVYKKAADVDLPRVTWQQEVLGKEVKLDELKTGDLLFFGTRGATHHVAMYIGDGLFIHAPETGDVVKITAMADFKPDFAKRLLD